MSFRFKQLAAVALLAMASQANAANVTGVSSVFTMSDDTDVIGQLGSSALFGARSFSSEREDGEKGSYSSKDFNSEDSQRTTFEEFARNNRESDDKFGKRRGQREDEREFEFDEKEFHHRGDDYHHLPSPVPEPESFAMLLAGLGMMAVVARRRVKRG
jgi:hypothetical protein